MLMGEPLGPGVYGVCEKGLTGCYMVDYIRAINNANRR